MAFNKRKTNKLNTIQLKTGVLNIDDDSELNKLVSFGSRINKKRGFFFISKVTGKHLPTKPSKIKEINVSISNLIPRSNEFTLFIGFAEAAVSLGQGVFEEYNCKNSFYIHTTRYKTSKDILLSFQEEHSHAPSHFLYKPIDDDLKIMLKKVTRIILIDDEVSTGNTAKNFIIELKKIFVNINNFYLYSILDWSKNYAFKHNYYSDALYKGTYSFKINNNNNNNNNIKSISTNKNNLDSIIPHNFGRYGTKKLNYLMNNYVNIDKFKDSNVLVLGTSEFMYLPYLLASYLEENKINTYLQSTTRSPINIDGEIISKLNFIDNYSEEIDNFLYNVIDKEYDDVIICYETASKPIKFNLKEQLEKKFKVTEIFFKENYLL
jgi:hypothetical protein